MKEKDRSTLINKKGRLIGYGVENHPLLEDMYIYIFFVYLQLNKEIVICLMESKNKEPTPPFALGQIVQGSYFAPFAQRSLQGYYKLDKFKENIQGIYKHVKFHWE